MFWKPGRLLPFTLTELLALLFFVLALALVYQWKRRYASEQAVEDHRELIEAAARMGPAASARLARVLVSGGKVPEDFRELTRRLRSDQEIREALKTELREAGLDASQLDTADILALVGILGGEAEKARAERHNVIGQLRNLQERVGRGLDHPPCWADSTGGIEYAFQVTLRTNTVTVRPAWPPHRADDAHGIPGMMELIGEDLSYAEFSRRALPVLLWSQRQVPECRHFVKIDDQVDGGKDAFKRSLLTVENFFYKLLLN